MAATYKDNEYRNHEGTGREMFWAYGVGRDGKCVLVACLSADDAAIERDRMKMSDARTVGMTGQKVAEFEMWKMVKGRGWKLKTVRNFN